MASNMCTRGLSRGCYGFAQRTPHPRNTDFAFILSERTVKLTPVLLRVHSLYTLYMNTCMYSINVNIYVLLADAASMYTCQITVSTHLCSPASVGQAFRNNHEICFEMLTVEVSNRDRQVARPGHARQDATMGGTLACHHEVNLSRERYMRPGEMRRSEE